MVKAAVVKCDTCSSARHLCQGCDKTVHGTRPFHDRNAIVNGHYLPIPVTTSLGSNGEWEIVGNLSFIWLHLCVLSIYNGSESLLKRVVLSHVKHKHILA